MDEQDACTVGGFVEDVGAELIADEEEGATGCWEELLIVDFIEDDDGFDIADFAIDEKGGIEREFCVVIVSDGGEAKHDGSGVGDDVFDEDAKRYFVHGLFAHVGWPPDLRVDDFEANAA